MSKKSMFGSIRKQGALSITYPKKSSQKAKQLGGGIISAANLPRFQKIEFLKIISKAHSKAWISRMQRPMYMNGDYAYMYQEERKQWTLILAYIQSWYMAANHWIQVPDIRISKFMNALNWVRIVSHPPTWHANLFLHANLFNLKPALHPLIHQLSKICIH